MSLIITVLAILGSPLVYLVIRFVNKKQWTALAIFLFLMVDATTLLFRPVCVPI